jgi:hypothetical protein
MLPGGGAARAQNELDRWARFAFTVGRIALARAKFVCFLGCAKAAPLIMQRQRLVGERGQRDVNRVELIERFGYDTKYAMHMLRLGHQGVEFLESGRLTLPIRDPVRTTRWMFERDAVIWPTCWKNAHSWNCGLQRC